MPTRRLQHGELAAFDPGDARGSWLFELPANPSNGDWVTLKALTFDQTEVRIDALSNLIYDPQVVTPVAAVKTNFLGDAIELRWNSSVGSNGGWLTYYSQASSPQIAVMFGEPSNLAVGTSPSDIVGWDTAAYSPLFNEATVPNPATGTITLPIDGIYRCNFLVMHTQGNSNKELSILYWFRRNTTDVAIAVFDVATDKTDIRNGSGTFSFSGVAGDVCKLGMSWAGDASPGTQVFLPSTFEIRFTDVVQLESV